MGWDTVAEKILEILEPFFKKKTALKIFKDASRIGNIARELIREDDNLNIDCCFLILIHKNGEKIFYRTVITGDFREQWMKNFSFGDYIKVPVDYEYDEFLKSVFEYKERELATTEIRPSAMKLSFEYQKVKFSKFFYLHPDKPKNIKWYLMVGTTFEDERLDTLKQRQKIGFALNEIRSIIKKY